MQIRKIDEMTLVKKRIPKKTAGKKYVVTDVWVCDKPGSDGYHPKIEYMIGLDLKELAKRVLEEEFKVNDVNTEDFGYIVNPYDEVWITYKENGFYDRNYQLKIDVTSDITEKDVVKNGIKSDML